MIVLTLEDVVCLALLGIAVILFIVGFIQEIVHGIFDDDGEVDE